MVPRTPSTMLSTNGSLANASWVSTKIFSLTGAPVGPPWHNGGQGSLPYRATIRRASRPSPITSSRGAPATASSISSSVYLMTRLVSVHKIPQVTSISSPARYKRSSTSSSVGIICFLSNLRLYFSFNFLVVSGMIFRSHSFSSILGPVMARS